MGLIRCFKVGDNMVAERPAHTDEPDNIVELPRRQRPAGSAA
jgi:hypothetical protein